MTSETTILKSVPTAKGAERPKVILAVDDSYSARLMIRETLVSAGYEVIDSSDGEEALEYARQHPVDLVLTDLHMPGLDGIALIQALRALPTYRLTPVLMLTTESSPERKLQAKRAGATGWMVKPLLPTQLLSALDGMLGPPKIPRT